MCNRQNLMPPPALTSAQLTAEADEALKASSRTTSDSRNSATTVAKGATRARIMDKQSNIAFVPGIKHLVSRNEGHLFTRMVRIAKMFISASYAQRSCRPKLSEGGTAKFALPTRMLARSIVLCQGQVETTCIWPDYNVVWLLHLFIFAPLRSACLSVRCFVFAHTR